VFEPEHTKTVIIVNPIATSYEIICAADRRAPKKAYLELLDQPAIIMVYTPNEDNAKKYKIPKSILDKTEPSPNGIIIQPIKATTKVNIGDKIKIIELLLLGITVSFIRSFKPSAPACKIPKVPTILGPRLR
jgi:hypothetical protein